MRKFKLVSNHSIQRIKGIVFSVLPLSLLFAIWHQPQTQYFQWIQQEDDHWSTSCCIYCLFGSWMIHRVLGNFGMLHNQTLLFEANSGCNIWPSTLSTLSTTVTIDFKFGWALQSSKLHCNNVFFLQKIVPNDLQLSGYLKGNWCMMCVHACAIVLQNCNLWNILH